MQALGNAELGVSASFSIPAARDQFEWLFPVSALNVVLVCSFILDCYSQ